VNPLWGQLKDTSVILIEGFGYFEVSVPGTETDTVVKNVEGKSLQETELGQCYCTLQVNTEDDVARTDYNAGFPTLFYRTDGHTEASLLHRVLTYAPHYSIGHVDDSLKPLNRIFSCENTSVLDFLNQVSEEIGCIFICDPYSRTVNAFDLSEHCNKCNGRHIFAGVCHGCKSTDTGQGYGRDVSLYIDTENLAEEITLSGDKDSLKNCFKLEGGDDVLTNRIGERLLGNTNYIWAFSDEMYNEMSDALRTRYMAYISYASSFKDRLVDDALMWGHTRFPEPGVQNYTPAEAWGIAANKITYTCISSKFTTLDRLSGNILSYVKLVLPSGYGCRFQTNSDGTDNYGCTYVNDGGMDVINTWWGYLYIYLKNCIDDSGNDIHYYNTGRWQLNVKHGYNSTPAGDVFGNGYFLYLKQQLDIVNGLPKEYVFLNYLRCHDDIGWGLDYATLETWGMREVEHKRFLNQYFTGRFEGSESRGELYNDDPVTQDARFCGTTASMCGVESALYEKDEEKLSAAIRQDLMLHAYMLTQSGIPMLYSGDEIGQVNDYTYKEDVNKKEDSRYVHRGGFPWYLASRKKEKGTLQQQIFEGLSKLEKIRRERAVFRSDAAVYTYDVKDDSVLCILRENEEERFIGMFNFSDEPRTAWMDEPGTFENLWNGEALDLVNVALPAHDFLWASRKKK